MCAFFASYFNFIQSGFDSWQGQEFFLFYKSSRPDLGPNPPQLNECWGRFLPGGVAGGVNLINLHSVELRMSGAIPHLPHIPSWCVA
jgi:hypothetical protein